MGERKNIRLTHHPSRREERAAGIAPVHSELAWIKDQLRDNERIWAGFRKIEIKMIGAHSLRGVLETLVSELPRTFANVDCVTLACEDPEYEMLRLLERDDRPQDRPAQPPVDSNRTHGTGMKPGSVHAPVQTVQAFVPLPHKTFAALFPRPWEPRLGRCDDRLQALLFPDYPDRIGSMALAPLVLRGKLIGTLNQGSRKRTHFTRDTATDLLKHLAAVTALCLDSAVSHERLKLDGLTDPLTEVANRRFFERRMAEEVERWARHGGQLICMLVDVDYFKQVNDTHGHQAGDQALRQVARLLGKDLRAVDVLARYGGEEFVLLLPNTTLAQGTAIAERLRARVAQEPVTLDPDRFFTVTVSIGLASLQPGDGMHGAQAAAWLFQQADKALYQAKQSGRNRVVQHHDPRF